MGGIGHVVTGMLSLWVVVFLSVSMADGTSFAQSDHGVAGKDYGLGVWKDSRGYGWGHSGNVIGDACDVRKERGQALAASVFMPTLLSVGCVFCSLMGLHTGQLRYTIIAVGVNAFNAMCLSMSLCIARELYSGELCDVKLKDLFKSHYAIGFLVVALVLSYVNIITLCTTAETIRTDRAQENHITEVEPTGTMQMCDTPLSEFSSRLTTPDSSPLPQSDSCTMGLLDSSSSV